MTTEEVRRLASLSRLNLTASEEQELLGELSSILDYFKVVDGITGTVPPIKHRTENALREDKVGPSDPEGVLRGVPKRKGRLVRAPRVF